MRLDFFRRLFSLNPVIPALPAPSPAVPVQVVSPASTDSAQTAPARIISGMTNQFEALRPSADRAQIIVAMPHPKTPRGIRCAGDTLNRRNLAALARHIVDNGGMASYGVELIVNHSVPVVPQSLAPDPEWRREAESYFAQWSKRADLTRRFDLNTLQRVSCSAIDTDGDVGWAMMEDDLGEPRIKVIEGWLIGDTTRADNTVDGAIVNSGGVIKAWEVFHDDGTLLRYDFNEMLLLSDPDRVDRYRGYSAMRRGMNDSRDASEIKGFEKLATKVRSSLVAALETQGGVAEEDMWGNDTGVDGQDEGAGNAPSANATPQQRKMSIAELLGGDIPVLNPGEKLNTLVNVGAGNQVLEFSDTLNGHFVAGLGLPPAFVLDTKLTGPNQRSVLGKAQRKFDRRCEMFTRAMEWTWLRVIGHAIANGRLRSIADWEKIRSQRPKRLTIDLGDQLREEREQVSGGWMSRQRYHGNAGEDWQREDDQIFEEDSYILDRAKAQAEQFDVPLESILARHGFTAKVTPAAEPGSPGGQESTPTGSQPAGVDADGRDAALDGGFEDGAYRPGQPRDGHGKWTKTGAPSDGQKSRAQRAKESYNPSTAEKQRRADAEQDRFAKAVRGINTDTDGSNEPFDVIKGRHAVEFKTMIDNKNDKLNMAPDCRRRKEREAHKRKYIAHTVCCDIRSGTREYYYKKGVGAFRLHKMMRVTLDYIRKIISE